LKPIPSIFSIGALESRSQKKSYAPPKKSKKFSDWALYFSPSANLPHLSVTVFESSAERHLRLWKRRDLILINACVAYLRHSLAHPEVVPLRRGAKRSGEALASFTEAPYPPGIDIPAL
jgi:hypothetical protein